MSRDEDKRLYEQKKCLFMGEIINTSFGCDEDFITSKLTACRTSTELESIENALFDTARTLDGIATERKAEGEADTDIQNALRDILGGKNPRTVLAEYAKRKAETERDDGKE